MMNKGPYIEEGIAVLDNVLRYDWGHRRMRIKVECLATKKHQRGM